MYLYTKSPTCTIWLLWSPHTLYGIGILWSPYLIWNRYHMVPPTCMYGHPNMWSVFMSYMTHGHHTLYGIGMVWSPTCTYGPPTCTVWLLWFPHTLYGIGIIWFPYLIRNRYHMVPPHVKCLHILYDSYVPPYHIWNRYHMVPQHVCMVPPHVLYDSYGSPIPYME